MERIGTKCFVLSLCEQRKWGWKTSGRKSARKFSGPGTSTRKFSVISATGRSTQRSVISLGDRGPRNPTPAKLQTPFLCRFRMQMATTRQSAGPFRPFFSTSRPFWRSKFFDIQMRNVLKSLPSMFLTPLGLPGFKMRIAHPLFLA